VKGGHRSDNATDIFCQGGEVVRFCAERVDNPNTHGTGCTLSSAIASNLAMGLPLAESVQNAKAYLLGALKAGLNLGKGAGPLDHAYKITL
jgi:hydroxymethylpyrimidine/phosphomethylpyrimidine kinase